MKPKSTTNANKARHKKLPMPVAAAHHMACLTACSLTKTPIHPTRHSPEHDASQSACIYVHSDCSPSDNVAAASNSKHS
jgi:hypothetical protein